MNFSRDVALYPYHPASEACKLLAQHLGIKRIKHRNSSWRTRGRYVVNWGCTSYNKFPFVLMQSSHIINHPVRVATASNKLSFFRHLADNAAATEYLPAWTTNQSDARDWMIEDPSTIVVCRTLLSSHEGKGIVLASTPEELVAAPLYTKYVKKKAEYRVHIMNDKVLDVQQKKRRREYDGDGDVRIRNTQNGFVFCRTDIEVPQCVKDVALHCVAALGLDFGGVDVIYNRHYDKAYVLEVNTAPGIEGSTLESYKNGFQALINSKVRV